MLICFLNCKNSSPKKNDTSATKYSKEGRFLIKETCDSSGRIIAKQYFNKDTVPDGALIEYYPNGLIATWQWYIANHNTPYTKIHYNVNGIFDSLIGNSFLNVVCCNDFNKTVVELINPPQTGIRLLYKDIYKGKVVYSDIYKPFLTDTVSWVVLGKYQYNKEHKYKIYFYIVDTLKRTLFYQDSSEIKE